MGRVRSISELESAIENLLKNLCEETEADAATFHHYDEPYDRLILPVGVNLLQPRRFKSWLPSMDRVAGRIVKTGESVIAEDAEHHPDTAGPFVYAENIKSSAGYLLRAATGRKVGVLFVNYRDPYAFSQEERTLLEESAVQIADTVEGWLAEAPDLKAELSALAGRRREEAALQEIADTVREVLGNVAVAIWMPERRGDALLVTAQSGLKEQAARDARLSLAQPSSAVNAFQSKKVVKGSVLEEKSFPEEQARTMRLDTVWAFPILSQSRPLGVLCVYPIGYERFTPNEETIIDAFVDQASATIESQRSILTLTTLHDMGRRLTFTLADPQQLMQDIVVSAARVMMADSVAIHQYDPTRQDFYHFGKSVAYGVDPYPASEKPRDGGVSEYIVEHGLLSITDIDEADPKLVRTSNVLEAGVKAYLGIRLQAGEDIVGVLFFNYNEKREFSPDDVTIATTFANYAATAIHNARVYEQVQKRIEALKVLNEVGQRLSTVEVTEKGLQQLLEQVAQQAKEVLDADLVELYRYSPGRDDEVAAHVFVGKKLVDVKPPKKILPDDVAAKVLNLRTPLFIDDAQNERLLSNSFETDRTGRPEERFVVREEIASTAAIPLVVGDEAVGVLFVNYRTPQRFEAEQRELIHLFASQAAAAIRNAQLFQQREALQRIARDITSVLDRDKLLQRSLERSLELLNCEFGSISVYDPATETLQFQYAVGKSPDMSVKLGEGLIGTAAETRKAIRVGDVSKDERYRGDVKKTQSEMNIPMLVGKRLIGVLNTESKRLNAFSEADQHLAEALAAQVAVAFRTTELYDEARARLQERVDDIKALQGIYALIGTAPLKGVLEQIAERAAQLTPAKYTGIWLLDEQARELRFGAMNKESGTPIKEWPRLPLDDTSISGHVALTGETFLCGDVRGDLYYKEWYEDVRSELTTPLRHSGRVIGILNLESTEVDVFTRDHVRLVEALSGAAAVAIQSARLYDRLDTLARVGQTVTSTLDLDQVLDNILEESLQALRANFGTLRLLNKTTGELDLRARRGEIGDQTYDTVQLGQGIVGWVAEQGEPLLAPDVQKDKRYVKYLEGTGCEVAVPIKVRDRTIGVLNIEHPQAYAFDEHDLHLLEAIANHAASAIRNTTLYESLVNLGQATISGDPSGDPLREAQVLELVHKQASRIMDTDNMYIALYDPDPNQPDKYDPEHPEQSKVYGTVRFGPAFVDGRCINVNTEEGWQPRRGGKGRTEEIIRTRKPIFISTKAESEAWYAQAGHTEYIENPLTSWVGVPMVVGEKVLGVVTTYHPKQEFVYSEDDLTVLQAMANQTAIALDNSRTFYDVNQRLEALVAFGRTVTSGRLREDEILELVYKQTSELMDTDNLYIALYEPDPIQPDKYDSKNPEQSEIYGRVRFGLAYGNGKYIDIETADGWQPRKAGRGRTEKIIRTRKPIFHATLEDGKRWYDEPGHEEYVGGVKPSWIGVPMMARDRVRGVIAAYHQKDEYVYSGDDLEILQALANLVAIALDNVALLQAMRDEQKENIVHGQSAAVHSVTTGFVHRMNNVAGTIPVRAGQIRELLDTNDPKYSQIVHYLDAINKDADGILSAAQEIRKSTRIADPERVDIDTLVSTAIRRIAVPAGITVSSRCGGLPPVLALSGRLINTLEDLIRNGVEAIEDSGSVTVAGRTLIADGRNWVSIEIEDTGHGIPSKDLHKIFDLFFSTKPSGMGLGLWGAKTLVESLRGRIEVSSEVGKGTTFTILLPVKKEA